MKIRTATIFFCSSVPQDLIKKYIRQTTKCTLMQKILFWAGLVIPLMFVSLKVNGQVQLTVTINTGSSTTICTDGFLAGGPEPHWSIEIAGQTEVVYPLLGSCFIDPPNTQYSAFFSCASDYPSQLQVCLNVFEDDGASCIVTKSCLETNCLNFATPAIGNSTTYTLTISSGASAGTTNFTITATGSYPPGSSYNAIDNATDLGTLSSSSSLGNNTLSNYGNFCSDNTGDPNPWGSTNDQGVWFKFTTGDTPSSTIAIDAKDDPASVGDQIDLQLALYESSDGTSSGTLSLIQESYQGAGSAHDEQMSVTCLTASTPYFLLVDGEASSANLDEGYFGLQIEDDGVQDAGDGCVLPVELIEFTGQKVNRTSLLQWKTSSEINNAGFTINRSINGVEFETIGKVQGAGDSNNNISYHFVDQDPYSGFNYYQLVQTDFDGQKELLGTVLVKHDNVIDQIQLYPNPVSQSSSLIIESNNPDIGIITIIDMSGITFLSTPISLDKGKNMYELNLTQLIPGVYTLIFENSIGRYEKVRFVK